MKSSIVLQQELSDALVENGLLKREIEELKKSKKYWIKGFRNAIVWKHWFDHRFYIGDTSTMADKITMDKDEYLRHGRSHET